jgi:anaerobic magnesium-protoporphyrin IX monomethyl ester cyclase
MKVALCSLNVSYIHKNLALRWLMVSKPDAIQAQIFESTTQTYDKCLSEIVEYSPDVVGLSCYIFNIEQTKEFILKLNNAYPKCRIILGGPEVTYNPDPLWDYPIEGIIMGEGEFSFWDAVLNKESESYQTSINQKVHIEKTDLNRLEKLESPYFLDFDKEDMNKRYLYVETSRGCPYGCAYCMASLDRKVRLFSESYMDTFFDQLKDTSVKQIKFLDRTFNVEPNRALRLGHQCLSMPESMHFHVELVGDTLHPSLIDFFQTEALSRFRMEIGVQSFQDKTLQAVGRMCNLDKLSEVIKSFSNVKAHQHTDLIAGLPFESLELFKRSYQKLIQLKPFEIQVGILKLLHGTVLHQLKEIYQYQAEKLAPYQITQSKWMSYDDIKQVEYVAKATEKCYNSQRLKEELDLIFEDSTLCAFDIMAECGVALCLLDHPYQVIEFYRTLSPILEKYNPKARFYIEKAYYRQAKLKPTLIFPMNSLNLDLYRAYLSHYTEMSHKAIWIEEEKYIYAIIYQKDKQSWFELNRQGELIRETSISYTK